MMEARILAQDRGAHGAASRKFTMLRVLEIGGGWFTEQGGGLNRYYHDLVRYLPEAQVAPLGLVAGSIAVERESGGAVRSFARLEASLPQRVLAQREAVRGVLKSSAVDLVASHFALYAFPAMREMGQTPSVVHFHGPWAAESRAEGGSRFGCWAKWKIESAVYSRANRLIVLSQAFAELLERDYRIDPDLIRVVPGGVNTCRFNIPESRVECRNRLRWPLDRPIVFCVRRLVHRMGLENLIDAAAHMRRRVPDALVLIAGSGPMRDTLRDRIASAGMADSVRLIGFIPDADLPLAYRAADLSVVPSISLEGFGLTAAESLAAGTPVLVTPVGGLPEVVKPLSDALLMPDAEPESIAAAIEAVLTGRTRVPAGEPCRAYAAAAFDWAGVVEKIRGVYEEALAS